MRAVTSKRDVSRERGATAIMVAFSLVVVFGAGALAVDVGNSWGQRRGLITATDAGSLGAATVYARGGSGCTTAAGLIRSNLDGASMTDCVVNGSSRSGSVTVGGAKNVDYYLAPIIGKNSGTVNASTTARWGIPSGVSGLRPFGLCADANPAIQNYIRNGVAPAGNIVIPYSKSQPTACGTNVPGNWGMVDFNGGSNSTSETSDWVSNGYPDIVNAGSIGGTCGTEAAACYPGDTGAFSNTLNLELSALVSSGEPFALPVFDLADGNGSGSSFHLIAFLQVRLVDFQANGTQANRYLTVQVTTGIVQGTCCQVGGLDTGLRVVSICAIDASNKSGCS